MACPAGGRAAAQEANVQRLKEMANFKKLVAPFPGTITVRTVDAGTLITAGASREIFRLARTDPLRVYVSLPQAYSQMVRSNDEAVLTFSELPGQSFTGRVDRTAGAIDPVSRTLLTEILVSNRDGKLFPGAHAMVRVNLAERGRTRWSCRSTPCCSATNKGCRPAWWIPMESSAWPT